MLDENELMNIMEKLFKNNPLVTKFNRIDVHFEMFMEQEKIPIRVEFGIDDTHQDVIYQVEMEYMIPDKHEDCFVTQILTAESPEQLVSFMMDNYHDMKKDIAELKNGFKEYTGINPDDTVTSSS